MFPVSAVVYGLVLQKTLPSRRPEAGQDWRARTLANAGLGVFQRDLRTGVVHRTDELVEMLGLAPGSTTGTSEEFYALVHPEDRQYLLDSVNACVFGGAGFDVQYRVVRRDGSLQWLRTRGSVERDDRGEPVLFAGITEDVTEHRTTKALLQEAESHVERMASNIPGVVYQMRRTPDGERELIYVSESVYELFGIRREVLMRRPKLLRERIHPQDAESFEAAATSSRLKLEQLDWVGRIVRLDGAVRWIHCMARPVAIEDGSLLMDGVILDVTEQHDAQAELQATKDRLTWILHSSPIVVYACKAERPFPITFISESARELLGIDIEQCLSDPQFWEKALHPDDVAGSVKALDSLKSAGRHAIEYRFRVPGGEYRWIRDEMRYVVRDGRPEIIGTARDVTERKATEDALRISEQRFLAMSAASPLGIFMADSAGRFVYANTKLTEITGVAERGVLGDAWTGLLHPDDQQRVVERYGEAVRRKDAASFQCRIKGDGRTTIWASVNIAPMHDQGEVVGFVGTLEDVTERHELELQTEQARIAAEKANQAKSVFLARISHEVRTPLHSILGFAQLLEMDQLGEKQRASVEQIVASGKHLNSLISEVLDIARAESGELGLTMDAVEVYSVVNEAVTMLSPLARAMDVTVEVRLSPDDRSAVRADRRRLCQALLNVVSNAIKFNRREGFVTVSHRRTPEGRVELAVSDTGAGIPTDKSDRLFVPFDRLGAEERGVEGTGLGLALSKRLVEAMGGSLVLDSDERTGTEVRITLEGVPQHAVVEPRSQAARTLLVLGGSESNTALVKSLFKGRPQYRLLAAVGGQEGLQSAVELRPDLVVLDTDWDEAIGLTQSFKDHPVLCDTKVIVMSDSAEDGHIERLKAAGAFAVVVKPLDLAAMLAHVDSAFGAVTR